MKEATAMIAAGRMALAAAPAGTSALPGPSSRMTMLLSPLRLAPLALVLILAGCGGATGNDATAAANDQASAPEASPAAPAAPPAAIPAAFLGRWDANDAACAGPGSELRLVVAPDSLHFYESRARIEAVRPQGADAVTLDLAFEGEGERWAETRTLRLGLDGRLVVDARGGGTVHRVRCDGAQGGPAAAPAAAPAEPRWQAGAGGEGASLSLGTGAGRRLTLSCPSSGGTLVVNVPAFRPVASEERMSLGSGGTVFALVADPAGDAKRGGVTGRGAFPPADLAAILQGAEGIGVNYGYQNSGPHAPPPAALARDFLAACRAR